MIESLLPTRLTARQKKEAERRRKEAAARKKREAEAKKRLAESRRRRDEAMRRAAEERRKREAAAKKRREAEAKRRREEEARRKREAEAKRKREEEARRKREEEARRRREEAEANRPKPPPVVTPPVVPDPEPNPEPEPEQPDPTDGTGTDPGETEDPDTTTPETEEPEDTEPDPTSTETAGPEPEEPPSSPDGEAEEGQVPEIEPRHYFDSQVDFSSSQNEQNNPVTEFKKTPDVFYDISFYGTDLRFDDGAEVEMWSFETDNQREQFPGPLARVQEGQIFQAHFKPSKGNHTIHWHGMEPDPRNDGVGHTSFEIAGEYTYQWVPEPGRPGEPNWGTAGTYFYHCHVNTTLHVQMGMFAPLIIDPIVHPDYPVTPGARRAFVDGPEYDIDTETLMVPYSMATPWHEKHHAAGLSGEDAGLNHFRPNHFYLLGGELARRPNRRESVWSLKSMRANVKGGSKKPTLLRLLNANYLPMVLRFLDSSGKPVPMAECIAHDGRPFRDTHDPTGPSQPCREAGYPMMTSLLRCGSAERWDLLLEPPYAGEYQVVVEFRHWITDEVLGERRVKLVAS
ncbi:multicopper oxidase type 3 [Arthrobacter crystallopoietes BAB-32]|uniref:Multicopper oxidase type 3 n=1 Tax=Arthrobacter crystallopoietes BAB-32 TaxID=1246476 RepID=N1V1K8_9MICC|nr:multicopper oxidase domain-containing protein [Arthrobacter crystallopoietes]EMY35220.1 multicopper oxidase type 3 [Arthrobacter crystallopoietes BAB-32]